MFRAHIADYAWHNVRDYWRDPPPLEVDRRRNNWTQFRYISTRYFESREDFNRAGKEAASFNIFRRPDDDLSNKAWWDKPGAVVALTRSRATLWFPKDQLLTGGHVRVGELTLST